MKPFALLNTLLAFFGGAAVVIAMNLYRDPCEYILPAFVMEYTITYISVCVGGMVMLLLAGLGCCAALQPNLKWRRVMLISHAAMVGVLIVGEVTLGLWLVLRASWALRRLPPDPIDPNLKQLLEEVSLAAGVDGRVAAWLSPLLLLQVSLSVLAGFEARRANLKLRLRRRLANERELTFLPYS